MKKMLIILVVIFLFTSHPGYSGQKTGITVIAVGDIMMGTDFPERYKGLPPDDGKDLFVHVSDILSQGNVVFGNLE
ncbi:MAG: CapA family protein [Desulfobacterales bacterium]|nr:CapA family protein [Desulfobacterales bacterium]